MDLRLMLLFCILLFSTASATQFIPIPIERQIDESDAVIHGVFRSKNYRKLDSGQVITQASFKLIGSVGLYPGEILNKNNFVVSFPGGVWQGLVYKIIGAPTFYKKEEVVLLLNKKNKGYVIKDIALGKYNIRKTVEEGTYLISSVFKDHSKLGKIKMDEFKLLLSDRFGTSLDKITSDRFVYRPENDKRKNGRAPASSIEEDSPASSSTTAFWVAILFGLIGGFSYLIHRRKKR